MFDFAPSKAAGPSNLTTHLTVTIPQDLYQNLSASAWEAQRTLSDFIASGLREWLEFHGEYALDALNGLPEEDVDGAGERLTVALPLSIKAVLTSQGSRAQRDLVARLLRQLVTVEAPDANLPPVA